MRAVVYVHQPGPTAVVAQHAVRSYGDAVDGEQRSGVVAAPRLFTRLE
jgi:hypothetical protein